MSIISLLALVVFGAMAVYAALEIARILRKTRTKRGQLGMPPSTTDAARAPVIGPEVLDGAPDALSTHTKLASTLPNRAASTPAPGHSEQISVPRQFTEPVLDQVATATPTVLPEVSHSPASQYETPVVFVARTATVHAEVPPPPKVVLREIPPLAFVESGASPKRASGASPKSPVLFDPEHYRRHAGVPGLLYMARNSFHVEGIYKLGYTTQTPELRVAQLNKEHRQTPDVGEFQLVHWAPVPAAYDAERALFDLLLADRPVAKREFFHHSEALLKRAIDATQALTLGDPDALDEFAMWRVGEPDVERRARPSHASILPVPSPAGGWIYTAQCEWHRSDVFRVSYTSKDPLLALSELDARQRRLTCRIGFHTLVHCQAVGDLRASWKAVAERLEPWRVKTSRVFFEIELEQLAQEISAVARLMSVPAPAHAPSPDPSPLVPAPRRRQEVTGEVSVESVGGNIASSWAPWAKACLSCGAILRFVGSVGARDAVECPCCGVYMDCTVGARGAIVRLIDRTG